MNCHTCEKDVTGPSPDGTIEGHWHAFKLRESTVYFHGFCLMLFVTGHVTTQQKLEKIIRKKRTRQETQEVIGYVRDFMADFGLDESDTLQSMMDCLRDDDAPHRFYWTDSGQCKFCEREQADPIHKGEPVM